MTKPKDPQAELREAIKELVDSWVLSLADEYDNASDRVKQTLEDNAASPEDWDSLLSPIMKLFQAHQQELLTELLGELPEKPKKDDIAKIMTTAYEGDNMARAYQLAINQVVAVIERKIGELNG